MTLLRNISSQGKIRELSYSLEIHVYICENRKMFVQNDGMVRMLLINLATYVPFLSHNSRPY